jgi:two-component system, NarL family, sensor histidine kinase ComP
LVVERKGGTLLKNKNFPKILTLFLVLIQIWFLHLMFNYPVNGISLEHQTDKSWVVRSLDQISISSQINIRIGDIVTHVNGIAADEYPSIKRWKTVDQSKSITLMRDDVSIEVDTTHNKHFIAYDLLSFLAELCSLFVAILLINRANNSKSAYFLAILFFDIGITFMSLQASIRGDLIGKAMITTCMMALPTVFYHFMAAFVSERGYINLPVKFLRPVYTATFTLFILQILLYIPYSTAYSLYRFTSQVTLGITVMGMLYNLYILFSTYFYHRKEDVFLTLILKTITSSLALSLTPIMLFSFIPRIVFGRDWINPFYTSWFIFILPLTFAYLIAAKKLYDIDMIMRRILFTGLIAVIPSALFTLIIRFLFPNESTGERLTIFFILIFAALTSILYSLENLTTKLEPVIFPRKYRLKSALKNISRNLGTISSLREMKDIILIDIIHTLEVTGGAILYQYQDHVECIHEGAFDPSESESILAGQHKLTFDYTLFEITRHEEFSAFIVITERKNRSRLNSEEFQWLGLIVSYLAISLENIHLLRKLTMKLELLASQLPAESEAVDIAWFRKLMFELQEKERYRIATDLHDTTMQDLFFLKNRLQSILDKSPLLNQDRASMKSLLEYIDIINTNLRQSCFELHPYLIQEIGLAGTIRKLIDLELVSSSFEIEIDISGAPILEQIDPEMKRHLFRLVQELLNNAKKHSQAGRIQFRLDADESGIRFHYEDNGVGFDPNALKTGGIGSTGIGMEQMKSRILSLNGTYKLQSSIGNGMFLTAIIPIKEARTA